MKSLAIHITNQKLSFDIFIHIYNVLLATASNIPQRLVTGFVLQGIYNLKQFNSLDNQSIMPLILTLLKKFSQTKTIKKKNICGKSFTEKWHWMYAIFNVSRQICVTEVLKSAYQAYSEPSDRVGVV